MEVYHMADIIPLIGIPYPPQGRSSYYVQCPACDDSPKKKHLNINLKKDVFRCPVCGLSGGIFDLYALYAGVPRSEAKSAIANRLTPSGTVQVMKRQVPQAPDTECRLADINTRHKTYTALLSKLSLASDHRQNLLERGLTEDEIIGLEYKTVPLAGMTVLAKQLLTESCLLEGVPGFYRDENNHWTFIQEKRGILIPVRDISGRIQGMQIRRDNTSKRKFRWISSAERKDGCHVEGWTHLVGPVRPTIVLTEGPMKADIVNKLSGLTVLAVPGVNSLTKLKQALDELTKAGVQEIKTAFDMDFLSNWHVQKGYMDLIRLLGDTVPRFSTYLWNPEYKGLDDYFWECFFRKKR